MEVSLTDMGHRLWSIEERDWVATLLRLHEDKVSLGFYDPHNVFCCIRGQRWATVQEVEAACSEESHGDPRVLVVDARELDWWQPLPLFTAAIQRGRSSQMVVWLVANDGTDIPAIIRSNVRLSRRMEQR